MAKDPAFLFYPGDFMAGTQAFTREEKGAYMDLLCFQFSYGRMPLVMISRCLGIDFERLWPFLKEKFSQDENGNFFNKRLELEVEKRKAHSLKQKNNISKRWNKNGTQVGNTVVLPLENENENRNENIIEDDKEERVQGEKPKIVPREALSKEEITQNIFSDERLITDLGIAYSGVDLKQAFTECYIHHSNAPNPPRETWEWRQKFNTWLTFKSKSKNSNGNGNYQNRKQQHTSKLAASVIEAYSDVLKPKPNG